jgi:SAM-dependent methyltransferase
MYLEIGGSQIEAPWKTVGVDGAADYCVDLNTGGIELPDECVERINCSHLVEHLEYDGVKKFFREIYRLLATNGIASFVVPNTDSNSWWKGFYEHYDLRMNPFFFRSISKESDSKLISKSEMWPDYDGHPFGMLQGYSPEIFDFQILAIKTYYVKTFSVLEENARYNFLHRYNTYDQIRVFLRKRVGSDLNQFDYFEALSRLPQYEIIRDYHYIAQKLRAYLDFSDECINNYNAIRKICLYEIEPNFMIFDFIKNHEMALNRIKSEFNALNLASTSSKSSTLENLRFELSSSIKLCESRSNIMSANKKNYSNLIGMMDSNSYEQILNISSSGASSLGTKSIFGRNKIKNREK